MKVSSKKHLQILARYPNVMKDIRHPSMRHSFPSSYIIHNEHWIENAQNGVGSFLTGKISVCSMYTFQEQ